MATTATGRFRCVAPPFAEVEFPPKQLSGCECQQNPIAGAQWLGTGGRSVLQSEHMLVFSSKDTRRAPRSDLSSCRFHGAETSSRSLATPMQTVFAERAL